MLLFNTYLLHGNDLAPLHNLTLLCEGMPMIFMHFLYLYKYLQCGNLVGWFTEPASESCQVHAYQKSASYSAHPSFSTAFAVNHDSPFSDLGNSCHRIK